MLRVANNDHNKLVFVEREAIAVFHVTNTVALSAVTRTNLNILRFFNFDTERTTGILHHVDAFVCAVEVVLTVQKTPSLSLEICGISMLYLAVSVVVPAGFASFGDELGWM
jgi:hypothetical protein